MTVVSQSQSKSKSKNLSSSSSSEPQTMEEILNLYGGKPRKLSLGNRIRGRVIAKDSQRLVLDIGGKSEGVVREKAFKEAEKFIKTLNIGDEVETVVLVPETSDGYTILSLRGAAEDALWKEFEESLKNHKPLKVQGVNVTSAGIMVDIKGVMGFIPNSQLSKEILKDVSFLIGKRFEAVVIDCDKYANKIVLSEKAVSEAGDIELSKEALDEIKEGEVYEGEITTIYDFGCFVRIMASSKGKKKMPVEGLVHVSEISWEKVDNPRRIFSEGDKAKVKVIGKKNGKLAFSIKQVGKDPWEEAEKKYEKDQKVKAKVTRITDFGVFVSLEAGVEGLIHMTKIPPGMKFKEGDEVNTYVEEVDERTRKISLGLVLTVKPLGYK